jgi:hypothetical protein
LGKITEKAHADIGAYVAQHRFDELVCVGELARDIVRGAREAGMDESLIFHFAHSIDAGKFLQERVKKGDVLLVNGSQSVRMEKVVVELMAEPPKLSCCHGRLAGSAGVCAPREGVRRVRAIADRASPVAPSECSDRTAGR